MDRITELATPKTRLDNSQLRRMLNTLEIENRDLPSTVGQYEKEKTTRSAQNSTVKTYRDLALGAIMRNEELKRKQKEKEMKLRSCKGKHA